MPLLVPHPKSAKSKKILPHISVNAKCGEQDDVLIYSKPLLPDLESEDEEEKDPIRKLSKMQNKEELERKDRWIKKFETQSRLINEKSVGAINRAQRCISAMDQELNE